MNQQVAETGIRGRFLGMLAIALVLSHRRKRDGICPAPLATPVIGGMVSSFIHILIVTPVLFAWLREREMKRT